MWGSVPACGLRCRREDGVGWRAGFREEDSSRGTESCAFFPDILLPLVLLARGSGPCRSPGLLECSTAITSLSPQIDPERQVLCSVIFSLKNCRRSKWLSLLQLLQFFAVIFKGEREWTLGEEAVRRSGKKLFRARAFRISAPQLWETGLKGDQIQMNFAIRVRDLSHTTPPRQMPYF